MIITVPKPIDFLSPSVTELALATYKDDLTVALESVNATSLLETPANDVKRLFSQVLGFSSSMLLPIEYNERFVDAVFHAGGQLLNYSDSSIDESSVKWSTVAEVAGLILSFIPHTAVPANIAKALPALRGIAEATEYTLEAAGDPSISTDTLAPLYKELSKTARSANADIDRSNPEAGTLAHLIRRCTRQAATNVLSSPDEFTQLLDFDNTLYLSKVAHSGLITESSDSDIADVLKAEVVHVVAQTIDTEADFIPTLAQAFAAAGSDEVIRDMLKQAIMLQLIAIILRLQPSTVPQPLRSESPFIIPTALPVSKSSLFAAHRLSLLVHTRGVAMLKVDGNRMYSEYLSAGKKPPLFDYTVRYSDATQKTNKSRQ